MPSFHLIIGAGGSLANPTAQDIAAAFAKLPAQQTDDFIVIERISDGSEGDEPDPFHSFMQTRPVRHPAYEGVFLIEVRDGRLGRQFVTYLEVEAAVEPLLLYLQNDESWRDGAIWRDISFQFEDLRAHLPPEEMAASFFEPGEMEAAVADRERRRAESDRIWAEAVGESYEVIEPKPQPEVEPRVELGDDWDIYVEEPDPRKIEISYDPFALRKKLERLQPNRFEINEDPDFEWKPGDEGETPESTQ